MVGVGTVVDAAIGWLVESILGYFFTEGMEAWIHGVGLAEDVEELKAAVRCVQMVVAAAKGRKIENKPLLQSLDDLKELLYDADDVMDELDYYRLKHQVESENSRAGTPDVANNTAAKFTWLPSSIRQLASTAIPSLGTIVSMVTSRKRKTEDDNNIAANSHLEILENKNEFSCRIKLIVGKLRDLDRDVSKALGIDGSNSAGTSNLGRYHDTCPMTPYLVEHNNSQTTSYPVKPEVYGRDAEMEYIFKFMASTRSNDIAVLPIVGVGGVGKTTIAQHMYNSPNVETQFQIKIWICVSDKFDVTRLTKEMLDYVSSQKQAETGNLNKLQEDLVRQMKSRRFLIVLDDVWDDMKLDSWDQLLAPLRCNQAMGNMILVTTRKLSVAEMTMTIEPVKLDALKRDDFWLLFKSCAFGDEQYDEDQGLCVIGKQIAEDLRGNPLAAKTVGALLKRSINVDSWTNILNNQEWKSLQLKGGIMPALKLSYDYLPEHLQQCFRYCCLFPKDYRFDEAKLVRIWISQGFVHGKHTGKEQEDAGKGYLAGLVDSGFFQQVSQPSHTKFVMHDLLHDLACQVSTAESVTIDGSECAKISPTTRHLSIVIDSPHFEASENFERKLLQITSVRKLRSLVLIGAYDSRFFNCFKNIFKEAHNLRFLQMKVTHSDFDCFISNLRSYTHIRYIEAFMNDSKDKSLPKALIQFFQLQVLDVGWGRNPTFPSGISNLVSMRHLVAAEEAHSAIANIGKMTALQELSKFKVQVQNDSGFDIRQLQFMSQLVKLGIYQLENVQSKQEASEARLTDKVYLEDVHLSWDDASSTSSGAATATATKVLEGLRPHRGLKHLQIIGYSGSSYPSWLATDISVTSLQSLRLEKCKELGVLPPLHKLPFIWKLELIDMPDIVEVAIPCLEELRLIELPRLEKCVATSNSKLNCRLQSLIIEKCPELNDFAPFTSENFCSSDVMQNSGMSQLESNNADNEHSSAEAEKKKWLPVLRVLSIHECPSLMLTRPLPPAANTQVSIYGLSAYPAIERCSGYLSVKCSNDLEVLDAKILAFQNLMDVTEVDIAHCPNLVFISFESFMQLNNLAMMTISNCGNLVSPETWRSTTRPAFPHLKYLRIVSCGGIAGKWLTEMLPHMQSLEQVVIEDCPEIKSVSIQEAESHNLASSSECEAVLTTCTALERLSIHRCRQLAVLEGLQYLSSLRFLSIHMNPELSAGWVRKCQEVEVRSGHVCLLPPSLEQLSIACLQEELVPYLLTHLPCLSGLHVYSSPNLTSLQLGSLSALKSLVIRGCDSLASLQGCLSELEQCEFWDQDLTSLQPGSLTALKHLKLYSCTGIALLLGSWQFLRNLTDLEISSCCGIPALLELLSRQAEGFSVFPRLEILRVDDLSVLATSVCMHHTSLRCLHLQYSNVVRFTDEQEKALQLLTSLQELEFARCRHLADLPDVLYSLQSLRKLVVCHCPCIARLPEKGFPLSLEELVIYECSVQLEVQCRMLPTEKLKVAINGEAISTD